MRHPDYTWVEDILIAARKIRLAAAGFTREQFEADEFRVLSVERLLITIGEAAKQISPSFRSQHPEIPWRQMAGMRDLIVHAYRRIDPDEIWTAVSVAIPALIHNAEPLVPAEMDDHSTSEQ